MFTGLIEEVGQIKGIVKGADGAEINVSAEKILEDINIGDSISVNGVCLTVTGYTSDLISFDLSKETIERSNFKEIKIGDFVNLERALKVSDRLGGHIVQGHVDTTGRISSIIPQGDHTEFKIKLPGDKTDLVVEKGSIAVDGISLTINEISADTISINIIPHTIQNTNLRFKQVNDTVNIEFDIIGKYVMKMIKNIGLLNRSDSLEKLLDRF